MKRLAAVMLTICAFALVHQTADAAPRTPRSAMYFLRMISAGSTIVIPPEWDGIWTDTDSVYDCNGVLQETSVDEDTLCSGTTVIDPDAIPFEFSCSGSATATTIDITCTGQDTLVSDCVATFTYNIRGTRTGDDAFVVLTLTNTVDGTDPLCAFLPDDCTQFNTHSHRTGPTPVGYCDTPTRRSTWGELKVRYR